MGVNEDALEEQTKWMWLGERLGDYRLRIKNKVVQLYNNPANRPLRFFTSHELAHCQAVEDILHRLIPSSRSLELKERERFYLLAAAWLHDIGMLSTVADSVWHASLSENEIRRLHHDTAARFIRDQPFECGVEEQDRFFLADLCRYHRKRVDLRDAPESMEVGQERYRFRLLAAYLRLADALHVDLTRSPDRDFILCLAYNIPPETKLHWIKSRLVSGIFLDADNHAITMQFQKPDERDIRILGLDPVRIGRKIDAVIRYVLDELREELASVMYTLTSGAISYYLDIQARTVPGVDLTTLNNLITLVMNYDVLVWPSASHLLDMILVNLAELSGYQLQQGQPPKQLHVYLENEKIGFNISRFLDTMQEDISSPRHFHLGIRSLLDQCRRFQGQHPFPLSDFIEYVDAQYQQQLSHRDCIRANAAECGDIVRLPDSPRRCHILLYGYSELVIIALSGLRDRLVRQKHFRPEDIRDSKAELGFSSRFRIFVCEGQPKTHTAGEDRLMYHDGISYALALRRRNFTNLAIIPDVVVSSVLRQHHLDYLLVGANGFSDDAFYHSAGHGSIIHLLRGLGRDKLVDPVPQIVLVVSSEKYMSEQISVSSGGLSPDSEGLVRDIDGYAFWGGAHEHTRDNVWINRDPRIRADLREVRDHVQLYNPREDTIPIALVDYVICDCGVFPVRDNCETTTAANIKKFLDAVRAIRAAWPRSAGLKT